MSKDDISKELEAVDETGDDDYFEEVLKQELEMPTDDDNEAGTDASDKSDEQNQKEATNEPETLEELKARLAEVEAAKAQLEKDAKGKLSDVVKSRREKSQMKSELDELKTAVTSLLEKRDGALKGEKEEPKPFEETRKAIAFDDDDKAYVDLSDVKEAIKAENKETKEELAALREEREAEAIKEAFRNNVREIIGEDTDKYTPAYEELKVAYKDLNDAVIAMQERLGIMDGDDGSIDQDRALDLLVDSEELKLFNDAHPGIDPTRIARAFNSKVDFRTSLRDIATVKAFGNKADEGSDQSKLDEKIKQAKDKPGSLLNAENQAGGKASLLDRIAELSTEEIVDMSDAEADKIEAMLEREALKGE